MICYHWTTIKNAKKILEEGLNPWSFIAPNPDFYEGEICLQVEYNIDWSKRKEIGNCWQAINHYRINPCDIKVFKDEIT